MSEETSENQAKSVEPTEGLFQSALHLLSSNLHQGVAAIGLSTPIEEFIDDAGHLVVRVDMPGMEPDDIEAKVRLGKLIIEGRRRQPINVARENVLRSEVLYGRYRRSLPLPSWVANSEIDVSYSDGVLELRLETIAETCPHTSVFKPKRMIRTNRKNAASKKANGGGRASAHA